MSTVAAVVLGVVAGMVGPRLRSAVAEALGAGEGCTDRRTGTMTLRELAEKHGLPLMTLRDAVDRVSRDLAERVQWAAIGPGSGVELEGQKQGAMSVVARAKAFNELRDLYRLWGGEGWPGPILDYFEELEEREAAAIRKEAAGVGGGERRRHRGAKT